MALIVFNPHKLPEYWGIPQSVPRREKIKDMIDLYIDGKVPKKEAIEYICDNIDLAIIEEVVDL